MNSQEKGRFISIEGIEGAGKTTQVQRLMAYLAQNNISAIQTREPGATVAGAAIRHLLLDPNTEFQDPLTESLLFTADRLEHIAGVIKPALEEGKWVVTDRYLDSTLAYQHGGRGLAKEKVLSVLSYVDLMPDLTIILDLSAKEGLERAALRSEPDRFEQEDLAFHQRVRDVFLEQSRLAPQRCKIVEVEGRSEDAIFDDICDIIQAGR